MNRIAQLRKEKHLNQTGFAMKFNITQYMVSAYESERHQPSIELLVQFADFFNVSVDYLIGRTDIRMKISSLNRNDFSEDEICLLDYFNSLTEEQKQIALGTVYALRGYNK